MSVPKHVSVAAAMAAGALTPTPMACDPAQWFSVDVDV
jgi:hypothetical protein